MTYLPIYIIQKTLHLYPKIDPKTIKKDLILHKNTTKP